MKAKRKLRKIVFENLDNFYGSCKKTCDEWDLKVIPIHYFRDAINVIKSDGLSDTVPEAKNFESAYNRMINTLEKTCVSKSKSMKSNGVSLKYLRDCIKVIKVHFNKGM